MDIIYGFGSRKYVFHSRSDLSKAIIIYAHCFGTLEEFETEMEKARVEFEYDLGAYYDDVYGEGL